MSNNLVAQEKNLSAVESALVMNDLSKLNSDQRVVYVHKLCESLGLNSLTNPFMFITLQGKLTLYATRGAADQLRKIHGVSISIKSRESSNGVYVVHVQGKDRHGKFDEATGIVVTEGLKGADLANAMLKAETKAKRRLTLSICGLGMLDESELDTLTGKFEPTSNPQIENPLDKIADDIPENTLPYPKQDLGEFVCAIGVKHKGKKLSDFDIFELDNYVNWLKNSSQQKGQTLTGAFLEFVETAESYLASREVGADSAADHI